MFRLLTITSAIALTAAAPSIAQTTDPMATPPAPDAPMTTPPAPDAPITTPAPAQAPAEPMTQPAPTAAAPAADAKAATVAQIIDTEFPSYDADKNGELSQPEFTAWVMALHTKAEAAQATTKLDATAKAKWAKDAFATADVDKSKKISKVEMSNFLMG